MSRLTFALLLAGVTGLGALVQPAWAAKKERVDKKLVERFYKWALANGDDFNFDKGRAKLLAIEPGAPCKSKDVAFTETSDELDHGSTVVLQSKRQKPFCYLFRTGRIVGEDSTAYYFKLTPEGAVDDKVMISHSKYHDNKPVRGSGKAEWTTLDAPGMRERLQHELDFWLKGMYRKPPAQTAAAVGGDVSMGSPGLAAPASAAEGVKDAPSPQPTSATKP